MEKQYETSLEWKKHDKYFDDLNKMLDDTAKYELLVYQYITNIYQYYAQVSTLMSKHITFINDLEKLDFIINDLNTNKSFYETGYYLIQNIISLFEFILGIKKGIKGGVREWN